MKAVITTDAGTVIGEVEQIHIWDLNDVLSRIIFTDQCQKVIAMGRPIEAQEQKAAEKKQVAETRRNRPRATLDPDDLVEV